MTKPKKRTKSMTDFLRTLRVMGACDDGVALVRKYATPAAWWKASKRGDHMLWLAARANVRREDLVLATCACARLSLKYVKPGEDRPRLAIEAAESWARGEGTTLEQVRTAAYADAADAAAAYAAYAAYAADAAAAAAAAAAADAAAAAAAADADAAAARSSTLTKCASLVRKQIPWSMVAQGLKGVSK